MDRLVHTVIEFMVLREDNVKENTGGFKDESTLSYNSRFTINIT